MEDYEIPSLTGMFHTITKWLHTGYTLTSFKEEPLVELFDLYNLCVKAIEKHNKEIDKNSKNNSDNSPEYPDSQKQIDLYNELRQ